MTFILKSIPTQISEYIELPDMAELLTYPIFFDISFDEAYKYATDFQKKLMDSVPIVGDKKYVTVLSQVRFLTGSYRSMTMFDSFLHDNSDLEWHIDNIEDDHGIMSGSLHETDRIHLFTSKNTCMTQFLKNDIILDHIDPNIHQVSDVIRYVTENLSRLNIETVDMPHNRIVTFTNHMHRAIDSKSLEFRYTFRVVETDRKRPPSNSTYDRNFVTSIMDINGEKIDNVQQTEESIIIHLPKTIKDSPIYRPKNVTTGIKANLVVKVDSIDIVEDQNDVKLVLTADNNLSDDDFNIFKENVDKNVSLHEYDNRDNSFQLNINNIIIKDNKIIAEASFGIDNSIYLKKLEYNILFDYEKLIRFSNENKVKVFCNL